MNILVGVDTNKEEWGTLVKASETGTWFQTPEAYEFFAQFGHDSSFASMPELFRPFAFGIENDGRLRGICSGYITVEKSALKQFMTRRAIIIGGPALADDAKDEEVCALMDAVRKELKREAIYIECRNFNDYSKWRAAFEASGFAYQPHLNFHVECQDERQMWERLSDNRRRQIKKASTTVSLNDATKLPNELQASMLNGENDVREWYGILETLYRTKVKTPLWPVEFFLEAYRQGVGRFLLVKHEGKVIGGSMVVVKEPEDRLGTVYEWFECGMNAEYKEQYPSVIATWAGMKWAQMNGCARYDMMGAGEPGIPYGVRDFKSEFGGELVEHGRFLFVCKPLLYEIGRMGVRLLKKLR